jgi:hypothetical protein
MQRLRESPQLTPHKTPHLAPLGTPQKGPQDTPHQSDAPQITPLVSPLEPPLDTPHPSPRILGTYDPHTAAQRIAALRAQGMSFARVADELTQEGIPTRHGLPWQHSSVRHVLKTYGG